MNEKSENQNDSPKTNDPDADNDSAEEEISATNVDNFNKGNLSDSELMEACNTKEKKNKSNLYLIKSYSFIDKTNGNHQRHNLQNLGKKSKTKTKTKTKTILSPDLEKFSKMDTLVLSNSNKKIVNNEKSKGQNPNGDLCEFHSLLRHQSAIENEANSGPNMNDELPRQRPKSMPINIKSNDAKVAHMKSTEPGKSAAIKRESFIRQSLQSIRRSFSLKKNSKNTTNTNSSEKENAKGKPKAKKNREHCSLSSAASTSLSSSSASSTASCASSNSAKNLIKDIDALWVHEEQSDDAQMRLSSSPGVVIQLNGIEVGGKTASGEGGKGSGLRSTNSVVTLPNGTEERISNDAIANLSAASRFLQSHAESHSVDGLSHFDEETSNIEENSSDSHKLNKSFEGDLRHRSQFKQQLSVGSASSQNSGYYSSLANDRCQINGPRTLKQKKSETSVTSKSTLGLDSLTPSTTSVRSVSPTSSRKSASGSLSSNSDNTAKNEQSSTAVAVASSTAVAATASAAPPAEKEKKKVSSSREKKFHRHFTQVPKDEKLINYFSCALVSDILLQGHLYITDRHFAFYSNVFGYVTKLVIPTTSVTRISREKTAKIIPNAVGVATADERHVFGSFISREAAFRLMSSVCPPPIPVEILPKITADIEISEENSIEDDSSCSISGNESPPGHNVIAGGATVTGDTGQILLRRTALGASLNNNVTGDKKALLGDKARHSDIPLSAKATSSPTSMHDENTDRLVFRVSAPPSTTLLYKASPSSSPMVTNLTTPATNLTMILAAGASSSVTSASTTPTLSTASSSSPTTVLGTPPGVSANGSAFHMANSAKQSVARTFAANLKSLILKTPLRVKFPTELSVVYLGVVLSIVLAVFSIFLMYRIVDIEARASLYRSPLNFDWRSGHDDDILAEALRWQRELQDKSTAEAQSILATNLEQIAKVRRSLETLSMLIRDRNSANAAANFNHDDSSD